MSRLERHDPADPSRHTLAYIRRGASDLSGVRPESGDVRAAADDGTCSMAPAYRLHYGPSPMIVM
jgi:hypothetical protein